MDTNSSLVVVLFSGSAVEAEMVKDYLVDNGISACLRNQYMGSIAPWYVSGGGAAPVDVEILDSDKERAAQLLEDFKRTT